MTQTPTPTPAPPPAPEQRFALLDVAGLLDALLVIADALADLDDGATADQGARVALASLDRAGFILARRAEVEQ